MTRRRALRNRRTVGFRAIIGIPCGLLSLFCVGGFAEAQDCPCWTAQHLASLDSVAADACRNELDLTDASRVTCTAINVTPDDCQFGYPSLGWVQVWNGTISGLEGPGCYRGHIGGYVLRCQSDGCDGPLTVDEALICAQEIAALGEVFEGWNCSIDQRTCYPPSGDQCPDIGVCSLDESFCEGDEDCPAIGSCSLSGETCSQDEDCPPGTCSVGGSPCYEPSDCPLGLCEDVEVCEDIQSQSCGETEDQYCALGNPVDQCFPPGCELDWNAEGSGVSFTKQQFVMSVGLVSEVRSDGDFDAAECLGPFTRSAEDLPFDPDPGEARYYLTRAVAGVSCLDHGDSGLEPDPRDALDDTCS
jgi:hypothetical protein